MQNLYAVFAQIKGFKPAYVLAEDPTSAQNRVENYLNILYPFSNLCKVTDIKLIAENKNHAHESVLFTENSDPYDFIKNKNYEILRKSL